ncbi:MAG TPA: hypothetical protein VJL81_06510 [Solirubrobacterales bacterium]|nr:hypothetical protein [Solirubrobacterales bacterium]
MTESRPTPRKPGGAAVFWASLTLFAVLFALLTYQLSKGGGPGGGAVATRPVQLRKVIKRRVVTTVIPSPGVDRVTRGPATTTGGEIPVEPIATSSS